ncbi:2-amino-3-carboxymuconate-6-semialdehyde decarboxylase [Penicillium hetheringtonii]|uniref:2-amino-3-carboxymuconate-6-semialdehyde decarboxylase n=1 Tax=Penicillium hetheringtonii TaxID=911720 RepID=A0AAD6D9A6_9EURO|nr:2-amino-3-carboxymuconate-6-semialdehyde decarboxylase [Penicillium hetheringtonii]
MTRPFVVDIHTHVYPPSYMTMLRARKTVPYIHDPEDNGTPRLIILSSDDDPAIPIDQRGRPVDSSYSDINVKLDFMQNHGINCSVISLANPWLDFLSPEEAQTWAIRINDDLNATCVDINQAADPDNTLPLREKRTLFAFGALPLSAPTPDIIVEEIHRLSSLSHIRGSGEHWKSHNNSYSFTRTTVFPMKHLGGSETTARYGHVLPLALGFPLETTIAVTRMLLSKVFDRFPRLRILLAHSGGAIPFLAGRIESCIAHERKFKENGGDVPGPQRSIWEVLRTNIYLDAVVYGKAGLQAAISAGSTDRLLFGTDHPFFPPLGGEDAKWLSVTTNYTAINEVFKEDQTSVAAILGENAVRILDLN